MPRPRVHAKFGAALAAVVAVVGAARGASAGQLTIGPYLQDLGPDRVTVKLEVAVPAAARLGVTGPDGFRRDVSDDAKRFHALHVDGLRPATTYEYRVKVGDDEVGGRFTTAPADARPFTFIAYGDSRSDDRAHEAVVRALAGVAADFLVNTGDVVAEGDAYDEWCDFFRVEEPVLRDRCVFAAVGNHELTLATRGGDVGFLRYFAPPSDTSARLYGTFRWSNTRFFMLNAMDTWTGDERAWLAAELAHARDESGLVHRIAVMHHGPWSSGPHGGNPRLADGHVVELLRDGKVDLILAGHDHIYERGEGQGLKYVISGGAGAPLYPRQNRAPETLAFESVHHFVAFAIDGDLVRMRAERASGGVIETCSFRANGPWECDGARPSPAETKPAPSLAPRASGCGCSAPGSTSATGRAVPLGLAAAAAAARRRRKRSTPT